MTTPQLNEQPNGLKLDEDETNYKMTKKEPHRLTDEPKKLKLDVTTDMSTERESETTPIAAFS